jgi:hypothetical protein
LTKSYQSSKLQEKLLLLLLALPISQQVLFGADQPSMLSFIK